MSQLSHNAPRELYPVVDEAAGASGASQSHHHEAMAKRALIRRMGWACMIALTVFTAAEFCCRLLVPHLDLPRSTALIAYERKFQLAATKAEKQTVVLLGDSHMAFAGYAEEVERQLHQGGWDAHVLNLASPSVTPRLSLAILERAKKAGSNVRLVALNVNSRHFNAEILNNPALTIEKNLDETYLGRCIVRKPETLAQQADCLLRNTFYLAEYRADLKEILTKPDNLLKSPGKRNQFEEPGIYPAREVSPGGWSPGYPVADSMSAFIQRESAAQSRAKGAPPFTWTTAHMDRLVRYCEQNGIRLVLVWLPLLDPENRKMPLPRSVFKQKAQAYAARSGLAFWDLHDFFNGPDFKDTERYFVDADHVNVVGAIAISDALAQRMLRQVPAPTLRERP